MLDSIVRRRRLAVLLLVAWAVTLPPVMAAPAVGEGDEANRARLLDQLTRNLESVDRAMEGTRELIQESMHRPYLPDLYLRLAELTIEKSRILYHLKRVEDPTKARAVVVLEANLLKTRAIDLYRRILGEFPDYAHLDKVLFFIAHEYRELGQFDRMMKSYTDLVERFPESPYRLETYLLIGDYHFDSMNLEGAEEAYRQILAAPESHVHGMARYKMAWCHINRGQYPEALALLEMLVADRRYEEQTTAIDSYKRINLRREALMDLAYCYTEVKPSEEALEYFADLSDSKSVYLAVLDKLGQRYLLKEEWTAAADVYRTILSLSRNTTKNLAYAERLFACAQAATEMRNPEENVRALIRVLEQVAFSWRIDPEEKARLNQTYEVYARDMATRLHLIANETQDRVRFGQAADAYTYYLDFFREGQQSRDILENQAQALYEAGRYFQAALAYESLAAMEDSRAQGERKVVEASATGGEEKDAARPAGPEKSRQECLYSAVASFHKALKEQGDLDDLQKLEARQGLRQAGSRYLAAYPGAEEVSEVAFNVAWVAYEQGDYATAKGGFRDFIRQYPQSKEAAAAGHLVLDMHKSLHDLNGLITDARAMLADPRIKDPMFRSEVSGILLAAEQRHLEELTVKVKDGAAGSDEALLALGREAKDSGVQELALYNLFVVSKEAQDIPKVLERGEQILAMTRDAQHREDVLATLAHFTFQAADFPKAAAYSVRVAERGGGEEQADQWLRAARLRGWMGNPGAAVQAYRHAIPLLPPAKRLEAEKELLGQFQALQDAPEIASRSRALMRQEPAELKWVFSYGEALAGQGRRAEASEAFRTVEELFARKLSSTPDTVSPEDRALAAQARFHRAGREMEAFRRIVIRGKKIDGELIQKKIQAHQAVEAAGLEVAQYASPRWTIASLVLAAEAHDEIARFFLEAPQPDGLDQEQRKQYRELLEDRVRPYREKALQYRQAALQNAYNVGIFSPEVIACYASLNGGAMPPGIRRGAVRAGSAGGIPERTSEAWLEALYGKPGDLRLLQSLALAYLGEGKVALAALVLQRCIEEHPQDAGSRNLLGLIRLLQGDDQDAFHGFQKALELDPGMDEARANLVVLREGYGNYPKARQILAEIGDRQVLRSAKAPYVHPDFLAAAGRMQAVAMEGSANRSVEAR